MKIQRRSRFQPSCQGPGSSQAVKVPVPAKQSRSRFQPSCQVPGSTTSLIPSIRPHQSSSSQGSSSCPVPVQGQVPVKFPDPYESDPIDPIQKHKFKFPDPRRVRSHRSGSPVSSSQGSSSCQVPGSTTSPIPSIPTQKHKFQFPDPRRVDPIDPTHHSSPVKVPFLSRSRSSSSSNSRIQIRSRFSHTSPNPIDPTQFYFSVYGSRFQTGPRLIASVGGSIPGSEIHQCGVHDNKFRSEVRAGSS